MPTKKQVQRKIVEALGWVWRNDACPGICPNQAITPNGKIVSVPNWPTNREDSYKLIKDISFAPFDSAVMSAYDESMLYLETEGWRWTECLVCGGDGILHDYTCEKCSGERGEWVKV